jgi:predicted nuclease of predicted toxin-antitoxin system
VRFLVDTNIVAHAVTAMRAAGHDVVYVAERSPDPGDAALPHEAVAQDRVFVTKDHDIGVLVHRDQRPHRGVLLIDDLGDAAAEASLILSVLASHQPELMGRTFLRVSGGGIRPRGS